MLQSLSFTGLKTQKLFLECRFRPHAGPACYKLGGVFWSSTLVIRFVSANTVSINFQFSPNDYPKLPVPVMTSRRRYIVISSRKVNKTEMCHIAPTTLLCANVPYLLHKDKVAVRVLHTTHAQQRYRYWYVYARYLYDR